MSRTTDLHGVHGCNALCVLGECLWRPKLWTISQSKRTRATRHTLGLPHPQKLPEGLCNRIFSSRVSRICLHKDCDSLQRRANQPGLSQESWGWLPSNILGTTDFYLKWSYIPHTRETSPVTKSAMGGRDGNETEVSQRRKRGAGFKERREVYQLLKIKKGSLSNESRRFRGTRVGKIMESGGRVERSIKHRVGRSSGGREHITMSGGETTENWKDSSEESGLDHGENGEPLRVSEKRR